MKTRWMAHDVVCWGSTEFGQDGHGTTKVEAVPIHQGQVTDERLKGRIKMAACGSSHTVAVTDSDEIFAWGNGSCGQIASPDMFSHRTPIQVALDPPIPDDVTITQVTCGMRHTMVLLSNGQVYAFGNNSFSQLGYDFQTENCKENQVKPLLLKNVFHQSVRQVSCGDKHSVFLFVDGSMAAVGNNSYGQLGDGTRQESSTPKPVDLDCVVKQIASGSNHNLAISGAGDVYVWGHGKGCGHRRHHVLSPELKLLGHDIVQVAGGGVHSMALTKSGDVYVCGFGTDGQLGLGDRVMTSATPRRLRHRGLRGCVSYIACGESYSAAVTREGLLYMWGRNSHCIEASEPSKRPFYKPVCIGLNHHHRNPSDAGDRQHRLASPIDHPTGDSDGDDDSFTVHSVQCGAWHALVLLGIPNWIPEKDKNVDESESDEEDDDIIEDDGMTSEGSDESPRSSISSDQNLKPTDDGGNADQDFGQDTKMEQPSSAPPRHAGVNKATSPPQQPQSMFPSRAPTKLTLGEFYALTDSSPSESHNTTPKSSPRPSTITSMANKSTANSTPRSPRKEQQQQQQHQQHNNETSVLLQNDSKSQIENKENNNSNNSVKQNTTSHQISNNITKFPEVRISSPPTSPDFSVFSESSLKKRIAENIEINNNKGLNFRNTRDWSGHRRGGHRIMSPLKPVEILTPSPDHDSPQQQQQGRLTPRASIRSKAASLTERSHTMFISKSTSDHFSLPREQTFISKQSMSLMDLGNLRSGAVFENQENSGNHSANYNNSESSSRNTSAGQIISSNASSRLSMVSPYTETDLREIISHKSPDKRKLDAIHTFISTSSDTPSNMMRYNRMKDMTGYEQNLENPLKPNHVLFATPSPNFGANNNNNMGNVEFKNNIEMHRTRTLYGLPNNKHYRKPGLPGVDVKTKVVRPGHLHGAGLHGVDGASLLGKKDKLSEIPMSRTLEITAPSSMKHNSSHMLPGHSSNPNLNNIHTHHTPSAGDFYGHGQDLDPSMNANNNSNGYTPSAPFLNLTPRRVFQPAGSLFRTRTMTQNPTTTKPVELAMDIGGAFSSPDGAAFRKDLPAPSSRPFHKNKKKNSGGANSNSNSVIKMKKNLFFEKAQTSLAISGAGTSGPKGQYLRQVNTSASSRNHRKM